MRRQFLTERETEHHDLRVVAVVQRTAEDVERFLCDFDQ
jgi:hypothetical protein